MTLTVYHLSSCDTCRKALKALAPLEPELVDVRKDGVPPETVSRFLDALGADVLINRRSTTWRGLSDAQRARAPLDLLLEHPTLMKRPVIDTGRDIFVGWSADRLSEITTSLG